MDRDGRVVSTDSEGRYFEANQVLSSELASKHREKAAKILDEGFAPHVEPANVVSARAQMALAHAMIAIGLELRIMNDKTER